MPGQTLDDRDHLRGRLAGTEDRFGRAASKRTVMVHLGESEVFEREVAELADGGVDVDASGA